MPTEGVEAPFIFDYELEALITFHMDEKIRFARAAASRNYDDNYTLAEEHRKRALELAEYKIKRKGK